MDSLGQELSKFPGVVEKSDEEGGRNARVKEREAEGRRED